MWCPWLWGVNNVHGQSLKVDTFLHNARRRIRTQQLKAEQFWQESEEALLYANQAAAQNNRATARFHLIRQKQLLGEHQIELDQASALITALQTVERALSNALQAQQLQQTNLQLADLLKYSADIEDAVDTLQDHHQRITMDGQILARSVVVTAEVDEEEIDDLMAASLELPMPRTAAAAGSKQTYKPTQSPQLLPDV